MFDTFFKALIALLFVGMATAPVAWADDDDDDGGVVVTAVTTMMGTTMMGTTMTMSSPRTFATT